LDAITFCHLIAPDAGAPLLSSCLHLAISIIGNDRPLPNMLDGAVGCLVKDRLSRPCRAAGCRGAHSVKTFDKRTLLRVLPPAFAQLKVMACTRFR
jgi:hypothetical protein